MAEVYKVGDIVVLKSGGPKMTVTELHTKYLSDQVGNVSTVWFAGAKRESSIFPLDSIERPKIEEKK